MAALLTADEVRELTGYQKPSLQIAWLRRNGVPHFVNAAGRPIVPASLVSQPTASAFALGPVR